MRRGTLAVVILSAIASVACAWLGGDASPVPSADVFTPAHPTFASAARSFFAIRSTPRQPIEFPHNTHVQKGLTCTDYCHESAAKGPIAGIPSVKTCMICHEAIAADRPRIHQVADYAKRRIEIPWQRVYGFTSEAHVRFQHAPHIRADVDCATCHGNVGEGTVAERRVELDMAFCVSCHKSKQASIDCLTCHF